MDIDKACNEYVTQETKDNLKAYIKEYNDTVSLYEHSVNMESARNAVYKAWMKVISNCPMGLELFMRVSTNYKQLQTIYHQRKNNKLKEWHTFCKMIESLPYFKELILAE